jgi:hypothetical protein
MAPGRCHDARRFVPWHARPQLVLSHALRLATSALIRLAILEWFVERLMMGTPRRH